MIIARLVRDVHLRGELVKGCAPHFEMDVWRAVIIGNGSNGAEEIAAVRIRNGGPEALVGRVTSLHSLRVVIKTLVIALPDFDHGVLYGMAGRVEHPTTDASDHAFGYRPVAHTRKIVILVRRQRRRIKWPFVLRRSR